MHAVPAPFLARTRTSEGVCFDWMTTEGCRENAEPLDGVRSATWGILYADDAGIASELSAEGLPEAMTAVVSVFEATGLTLSPKKTGTKLNGDIQRDTRYLAAPRRSTRPEIQTDSAGSVPGRPYALSTKPPTLFQSSDDGSDSRRHASIVSS